MNQSTSHILLIRPAHFGSNVQTSQTNSFQEEGTSLSSEQIEKASLEEFDHLANVLKAKGVNVHVIDDTPLPVKPDALFPNNWVTFHQDGKVLLYPMLTPNRMAEKRPDIIEALREKFQVSEIIDLTTVNQNLHRYLEGTGSMVFDHVNSIAYASLSPRTHKDLFEEVCRQLGYQAVHFHSFDMNQEEIYHTNVMMSVAEHFAVICLASITDKNERERVLSSLLNTGHQIIDISLEQMHHFAGNLLALETNDKKTIVALSQSAFDCLTNSQKTELSKYGELVPVPINTIETIGGGSVRCMIAEIFLKPR